MWVNLRDNTTLSEELEEKLKRKEYMVLQILMDYFIRWYQKGDWGDASMERSYANNEAIRSGEGTVVAYYKCIGRFVCFKTNLPEMSTEIMFTDTND